MDLNVRRPVTAETDDFLRTTETAFSHVPSDEDLERERLTFEVEHALAAYDGDRMVATAGAYSFDLTLPGGTTRMLGVTSVGVLPTHRRRGLLRALMYEQLTEAADRGWPVAGLLASEGAIYGRFGYGTATTKAMWNLDCRRASWVDDAGADHDRIRLLDGDEDERRTAVAAVWDRYRQARVGELTRSDPRWQAIRKAGGSGRIDVVHDGDDGPDGVATYRVNLDWNGPGPVGTASASIFATRPEVELALWRFLADIDLVTTVRAHGPIDSALPLALADRRAASISAIEDHLWIRVLDVASAFTARTYERDGAVTFAVDDPIVATNTGTWRLEVSEGRATCARATGEAEVTVTVDALGTLLLGGAPAGALWSTGRVRGDAAAAARLDALCATRRAPLCLTGF